MSVLAYTLGLRHGFDADHISAIDNTTRKVIGERNGTGRRARSGAGSSSPWATPPSWSRSGRPSSWRRRRSFPRWPDSGTGLQRFGGLAGTVVSASFLFLIGLLNLVILAGIVRVFAAMRRGEYDEAELERQLAARGFFSRFFGRWMRAINAEWQLYPVGVLFGLGFDTATEVALLASTALLASQHIPWYAIVCLPVLFTAGMTLMDTTDGLVMNLAYGWALFNPVRKVYYNLAITGLSVAVCFAIGGIEALGLLPQEIRGLSRTHGFWGRRGPFQHQHRRVRHRRDVHRSPGWPPCSSGGSAASSRNGPPPARPRTESPTRRAVARWTGRRARANSGLTRAALRLVRGGG